MAGRFSFPKVWIDKLVGKEFMANAAGNGISRVLGSLIPILVAWCFGIGKETDLFFFALAVITFLTTVFSITLETVSVPFISDLRRSRGDVGAFVGILFYLAVIVTASIAVLCYVLIGPALTVFTQFSVIEIYEIRAIIISIMPVFFFVLCSSLLVGALNALSFYFLPSVSAALRSVVVILIIYLGGAKGGIISLPLAFVAGEAIRLSGLWLFVSYRGLFTISLNRAIVPFVKEFLRKGSYQIGSALLGGINPLVDRSVASWIGLGGISIIEYADRLNTFPIMFLSSVLPVLLSRWSNEFDLTSVSEIRGKVARAIRLITLPTVILVAFGLYFSHEIVRFVYLHGGFPQEKVSIVSQTFSVYLLALWPNLVSQIIVRAYLALKVTRILMSLAAVRAILNVVFDLVLMKYFGVVGIALSTTLCTFFITTIIGLSFFRGQASNDLFPDVSLSAGKNP